MLEEKLEGASAAVGVTSDVESLNRGPYRSYGQQSLGGNGFILFPSRKFRALGDPKDSSSIIKLKMVGDRSTLTNFPSKNIKNKQTLVRDLWEKAEKGNPDAQHNLSIHYVNGEGVRKNLKKTVEWYLNAVKNNHMDTQLALSCCYGEMAIGVKDPDEQEYWWEKELDLIDRAVDQAGQNRLAGKERTREDGDAKAVIVARKKAERGDRIFQYTLGFYYYHGVGTVQNLACAAKWFERSAEQGYDDAQNMLGVCYELGIGATKNAEQAFKWYKKATLHKKSHPSALHNLAHCYQYGIGTSSNPEEARFFKEEGEEVLESTVWKKHREIARLYKERWEKISISESTTRKRKGGNAQERQRTQFGHSESATSSSVFSNSSSSSSLGALSFGAEATGRDSSDDDAPLARLVRRKLFSTPTMSKSPATPRLEPAASPPVDTLPFANEEKEPFCDPEIRNTTPTARTFNPKIQLEEIASQLQYSPANFFYSKSAKRKGSAEADSPRPRTRACIPQKTQLTQQARDEIGRWGEMYVFDQLQKKYLAKYPGATIEERDDGFVLKRKSQQNKKIEVEVTWYNKRGETRNSLDLKLIKRRNGKLDKTCYIEVKTTEAGEDTTTAHFSREQVEKMIEHRREYALYRVYGAGKRNARVGITKDPWGKLKNEELHISSIGIQI